MSHSVVSPRDHRINWVQSVPFFAFHVFAAVAVFFVPFHWSYVVWALALYYVRMWVVTTGYHRYFAHRAFKTSRVFQFLLAFFAETSAQKGVLWWAANHRHHHRESDQPADLHSPLQDGFWWSHVGWILSDRYSETREEAIRDFARFPELRFLNRWHLLPPFLLAVGMFLIGGFPLLVWGFFVSTVLLWHGTFTINSLSHVFGSRRYRTTDTSRNNFLLALITCGEGWHNNHHYHQNTANQGWFWWELDLSFYALKLLSALGLVWDLRLPSPSVKYAFRKYSAEERAELRSEPAILGKARLAALAAQATVAGAMKGATELAGPAPLPVLKRR
jgi:stearoyl-CoA desaturase (delta-9 desaturase)